MPRCQCLCQPLNTPPHHPRTQALGELDRVKRQLKQPFATKETIAASISRLEDGLRKQAQVGGHGGGYGTERCNCVTLGRQGGLEDAGWVLAHS